MTNKRKKKINIIELFAGVGGFRVGFEKANKALKNIKYEIVWSNQYEPTSKAQHASDIYEARWPNSNHSRKDISQVKINDIPKYDMLVGGFPCQDYSVARTLNQAAGLIGKKGVLWWEIHRIITQSKAKPKYLLLENVDRLLKSPASHRGRDFAIMLASLNALGYAIEWRIINAAEYGMPQRRKRVFILGYHKSTPIYKQLKSCIPLDVIGEKGIMAKAFPIKKGKFTIIESMIGNDPVKTSSYYNYSKILTSPFENAGFMINDWSYSCKTTPKYSGKFTFLKNCLEPSSMIPKEFYVNGNLEEWTFLKGAKRVKRKSKLTGHEYEYAEGAMTFPDPLDKASRTIVTGEGGSSPSRFKHIIQADGIKKYRRLLPIELERLNQFPDNHTKLNGISDIKRAFLMGNALVVGIVERLGVVLAKEITKIA